MPRFDQEIAEGTVAEATVTLTKDFGKFLLPPSIQSLFTILPRFALERFYAWFLRNDAKNAKGDDVPSEVLIPTFHFDYQLVAERKGSLESFKAVRAEVLLLGGSESPSFLKHTLDALSRVLPNVERVELQGFGHGAALDGGKPERVAQELRRFLL